VVKTIGDEVMVVGQDVGALVDWAVGFTSLFDERPEPRIGVHYGTTLYPRRGLLRPRRELAARVVARARGGEVLVSERGHRRP
jgi:adenylate cyclase